MNDSAQESTIAAPPSDSSPAHPTEAAATAALNVLRTRAFPHAKANAGQRAAPTKTL